MSWTDDRIATLKKMWKDGKSAAEIAKTLGKGVTRNAVIGKAHRMGLSGRPSPIKEPTSAPPAPAAKKSKETAAPARAGKAHTPAAKENKKSSAPSAPLRNPAPKESPEPKKTFKDVIPPGGGVALIDLTERMCKWPIGDPRAPDFTFCGRSIRAGTPYCPEHASVAYQSSSRSRNMHSPAANEDKETEEVDEAEDAADDEEEEDDEEAVS